MLVCEDLGRSYGAFSLGPIDCSVSAEVLAVLGPSGAGKTTLLSLIAGIRPADGGTIRLDGRSIGDLPPEERDVGLVFQDGALFPHMTARENIAASGAQPERVASLAADFEVSDVLDQRATTLSGGQAQRVALARTLAAEPSALLLDEPLAKLDEPVTRRLRDELATLLPELGVPVIYVTHDQRDAAAIGDRVAVLADGTIQQIGSPAAVFDRPATPFVAGFTGRSNVFEGVLEERDGDTVLQWAGRDLCTVDGVSDRQVGHPVTFALRSERIEIVGASHPDGIGAVVERSTVEGATVVITLAVPDADSTVTVTTLRPAGEALDVTTGGTVHLVVPTDAVHVFDPGVDGEFDHVARSGE
jgi:molybdate/tungstate transport system ATP-binding protein